MIRVLFVCTGNICRSPTAEGVARAQAAKTNIACEIESAGIGAWHVGESPDARSIHAAAVRGYDLSTQKARQIDPEDFHQFDHIIALDKGHLQQLRQIPHGGGAARLSLLMDWADGRKGLDVPDPYYGEEADFDQVLDLVETAIESFLNALRAKES